MTDLLRARAVELREDGESIRQIAERLELPRSTIGDWVLGIEPLPSHITDEDPDAARLSRLRSWCASCCQRLPWTSFWARSKWPDGTMRVPQSHCRDCVKARRRTRRHEDPAWAREQNRREWQRIKSDPEKLAKRRELTRENLIVHRLRRRETAA